MKISKPLATLVTAIIVIAAVYFLLRSCGTSDTKPGPLPAETATTPSVPSTSTDYIESRIKSRLEVVAKRSLKVVCPARVDLVKGTKMTCKVLDAGDADKQLASANVIMTDRTGKFTWKSVPV